MNLKTLDKRQFVKDLVKLCKKIHNIIYSPYKIQYKRFISDFYKDAFLFLKKQHEKKYL